MVAESQEHRRLQKLTAAEMVAPLNSNPAGNPPPGWQATLSKLRPTLGAIRFPSIGAVRVWFPVESLLWRWPAAMWRKIWDASPNARLRWVAFAPWVVAVFAPVFFEILQDVATWVPPESASGLETFPHFDGIRALIGTLNAWVEATLNHFATLPEALLWWPVLAVVVAYAFTGPLHVMLAADRDSTRDSHGSAAWGTSQDAVKAGHLLPKGRGDGLMLGRVTNAPRGKERVDPRFRVVKRHVVTLATTGAGKGVGGAIPNLLEYRGCTFSVDPKAELYKVTARARLQKGFKVARLDPFGCTGKPSHSVNWLDGIDPEEKNCVAESAQLADALVVRRNTDDSHWDTQAAYLLQGLILHVATLPENERHMGTVRQLLTSPIEELVKRLKGLQTETRGCGVIAKMANTFLAKADRERSGVLSTAQGHTAFLDDPQILATLSRTDFSFAGLKDERLSVYLVVPPEKISAYNRYIRATLNLALGAMTSHPARPTHPVLFLIDEPAQLGRMSALENNIAILRSYGVLLWLFFQDLPQLRAVYPKWESFLGNACWQVFGVQDQSTARYFSEALGNKTVRVQTAGTSTSVSLGRGSHGQSCNESYIARPLMTADELRRMALDQVVVIQRAESPMRLRSLNYLKDSESAGLAEHNPDGC